MSFTSRLLKKVGGQRDHDPNKAPQSAYYSPPPASPYQQFAAAQSAPPGTNLAPTMYSPPPLPSRQQSSPHESTSMVPRASSYSLQAPAPPIQQGWMANAPPSPYLQYPSPQTLQPYDPATQQAWLGNAPPTPYLRQPSPQPQTVSPPLQSFQNRESPTQQGWLANPPPTPYIRHPSPQPPTVSPPLQSLQKREPPTQQGRQANPPNAPYIRQLSPQPPQASFSLPPSSAQQSSANLQTVSDNSRQRSARREPPQVRKILSLDGGGVRGLSIITIVRYIMKNLNRERGFDLEPWEEFDMIGGTSTGG